MSITPAFSPGPWITQGAFVGSVRRWIFDDLYEQCSFHIAEKMPSSVKVGVRPISLRMCAYSSGVRPWAATSAGVTRTVLAAGAAVLDRAGLGFLDVAAMALNVIAGRGPAIGYDSTSTGDGDDRRPGQAGHGDEQAGLARGQGLPGSQCIRLLP